MSWIFGHYSKHKTNTDNPSRFHPVCGTVLSTPKYYIAAGGNENTTHCNSNEQDIQFFVCGLPVARDASQFIGNDELYNIINKSSESLKELNGHFCGVFVKDESLTLFTDQTGLREFYIYENDKGWYFSSHLNMILPIAKFEIDFNTFGSRWKSINQISGKSIVKNIIRLNSGAQGVIKNNSFSITNNNWIPTQNATVTEDDFNHKLSRLVLLGTGNNSKISLSLSGGMDSRVILSYLLNSHYKNWNCHTFITESSADNEIAKKIASDFNIEHKFYSAEIDNTSEVISELSDYVGATFLTESVYTSRKLSNYKSLPNDELIIDGGFGEIWRREFLARLYHFGKNDLRSRNYANIANYLSHTRANIFTDEVNDIMDKGIIEQTEHTFSGLPSIDEIGIENTLDLFALKTRLLNYYAPEQGRIDNYVTSYMPFVQLYLLNDLFNLPVNLRKNNRLFKAVIKTNKPELTKYNLAKGDSSYPFYLTPLMKRGWTMIHGKLNPPKANNDFDLFLHSVKEFIYDSLNSKGAKEYAPYKYNTICDNVNAYFAGNKTYGSYVDWFLTFEIFRQKING